MSDIHADPCVECICCLDRFTFVGDWPKSMPILCIDCWNEVKEHMR